MQNESTKSKWMWVGVNAIVILYAFIPVLWIVSLSLKDSGSLNDGNFWPRSITGPTTGRRRATRKLPR